jgi:hypothetical protein
LIIGFQSRLILDEHELADFVVTKLRFNLETVVAYNKLAMEVG